VLVRAPVEMPSKLRFARLAGKARAALSDCEGATLEITEATFGRGRETAIVQTVSRSGDYVIKHQPGDSHISLKRGTERWEYCPSWGLASRSILKDERYYSYNPFEQTLSGWTRTRGLSFWLYPLLSVETKEPPPDLVLTMAVRMLSPLHFRHTSHATIVLDQATLRPKKLLFELRTPDGRESYRSEIKVLEYYDSLPANTFSISLPEDALMLGDRIQSIIQSDEDQGHRLSLFECSQDEIGKLLMGFASREVGQEDIYIDAVRITDVKTGNDMSDLYDRHWSSWICGSSDNVTLLCLTPKSEPPPSIHNLHIDVFAGIFRALESPRISGAKRVRKAQYTFRDVSVNKSPLSPYPECTYPPWYER